MKLTKQELTAAIGYALFQKLFLPGLILGSCAAMGIASNAVANLIYYTVNCLCWGWIFRRILLESLQNSDKVLPAVLVGIPAYYACSIVVNCVIVIVEPTFSNVNDANVTSMLRELPALAIAVSVLVPVAEECFYRGLLFVPFLHKRTWLGYVLSCTLFAAAHVTGYLSAADPQTLLLCFLQYLPAGLVLCWVCKRADSLLAPIAVHAFVNAMSIALMR